ncbi:helix-turn-helix domain containing protein [Brevibacillus choshinensis]|uniref:helix-turn-helix domain-containing protein n=1 Tax=Brevibacillus choshinensis TaxID=54911 RepID=UPI002E1D4571|nr:helix-turn-helix domain containing protein [Brevibacillus choshinensis]
MSLAIRNSHNEVNSPDYKYSDCHVFGLADLPEEDRKRYEAMGFTVKPVEPRVIRMEIKKPKLPESLTRPKKPKTIELLTVAEYHRMKEEGMTDKDISRRYQCCHNTFSRWKRANGLIGTALPKKSQSIKV